jgi:trehalose 6-phosphate phosphatase
MNSAATALPRIPDLPCPPLAGPDAAIFLDFDGTLVPLAPTPDAVAVDPALPDRLRWLVRARPGRVALVSGRDVATIDALLGPVAAELAVAGSHGAELRQAGGACRPVAAPDGLAHAADELAAVAAEHGLFFERKPFGVGLHYRLARDSERFALEAARQAAERHGLVLQLGKMMAEVRAPGDKGRAVEELLALPAMIGARPFFFGDDVTDEDGFAAAVRAGGAGVLVGEARPTAARYRLPDPRAVSDWIEAVSAGEGA